MLGGRDTAVPLVRPEDASAWRIPKNNDDCDVPKHQQPALKVGTEVLRRLSAKFFDFGATNKERRRRLSNSSAPWTQHLAEQYEGKMHTVAWNDVQTWLATPPALYAAAD